MNEKYIQMTKDVLHKNMLCTLATASPEGKPEAATVEFVADDDFNIYFETFASYRKYANLRANPHASVVVTQVPLSVQIDGKVRELLEDEAVEAKDFLMKVHGNRKWYEDNEIRFFKLTPNWIRLLTDSKWPPKFVVIKDENME